MKIVVTGATGNVGTSVVRALGDAPEVDEVVGLARRRPTWEAPKAEWRQADVVSADLRDLFEDADVVIHLAWAIQPSRDRRTLELVNLEGSRRVFGAAGEAGVGKLIHASSIGAYSPGPEDEEVDESWPTGGIESSFYSRHKAAVERMLDEFERERPQTAVVRMRPALIFKGEAATEIRRLFAGPFLPDFLLRHSGLIPALPRIDGLAFQAVHSDDVGEAYARAAVGEASGAFNLAAEPRLSSADLAEALGARSFPVPSAVARRLADLSWRLRLQPSPPGWLDMALAVPSISSRRAREELGWEPRRDAREALRELLEGIGHGQTGPTPPLEKRSRLDEVRTGVGARQWRRGYEEQLKKYLADAHSIELQALTQMRAAPKIAGDERLAELFREHEAETEVHERRVRARLEGLGGKPSTVKDLTGEAGGIGMLLFAAVQPDSPGKLVAHGYSYEQMELAAYELLRRLAEDAGDTATAEIAGRIAAEEERMAGRLADSFDIAVDASLGDAEGEELERKLVSYLSDAHAIERQSAQLLEAAPDLVDDEALADVFREHLGQTRAHAELLERRLEAHEAGPSKAKDAALRTGGLNLGGFFGAQPDTTTKLAGFAFAFENLEIASYELLSRAARRAGDEETAAVAEQILEEERSAAAQVAATWDRPSVHTGVAA